MLDLKPLWEIQLLDSQRKALEIKLKEGQISKDLKALRGEIEQGRADFDKLKEKYNSLKKELKKKEMDAAAATEQVDHLGQKLYSGTITNIKEINTSKIKLDSLKSVVNKTEDEILNIMEHLDSLRAQLEKKSVELNKKADEFRKMHGTYLANQQKIKSVLAQLPLSRQKILDKLDIDLWNKYQEMKKRFNDPLAKVEKGICLGCRMGISFNDLRLLKHGADLVYCSNCGRLLFWER
ncbi:putative zinc ribbon domain protein [Pelotomaculum sp. FP]|uniref:zinc ribbon domain-containing protein n=1 Tax=Pelotomaculum sp. FP TaxID=261474 RepID=UPI001064D6EF|nr:C4-type zinc ribbon domain-containing protein [Pelotomaculum sp. FP]TEB15422.1 putative zinc ribbon domain protein [Pelotomaculum sp. FP]